MIIRRLATRRRGGVRDTGGEPIEHDLSMARKTRRAGGVQLCRLHIEALCRSA